MHAKFGHDQSSRLAAYTWQTHTHTQNLYYIDIDLAPTHDVVLAQ